MNPHTNTAGAVTSELVSEAIVGRYLDRLVTVEVPVRGVKGFTTELYEAALARQNSSSLVLAAARSLTGACAAPGATVLVLTGAGNLPWFPVGETDGPPGAAMLARALGDLLGARVVFPSERHYADVMKATATAAGIPFVDLDDLPKCPGAGAVVELALDSPGEEEAARVFEATKPAAVVSSERIAPSRSGAIYSLGATDLTDYQSPAAQHLLTLASQSGIVTIGIGDGGNELGAGVIESTVRELVPFGPIVASAVSTDVYVHAATSDWGALAVAVGLRYLARRHEPRLTESLLERVLIACAYAGANDSVTLRSEPAVDGAPLAVELAMLTILNAIVDSALTPRADHI